MSEISSYPHTVNLELPIVISAAREGDKWIVWARNTRIGLETFIAVPGATEGEALDAAEAILRAAEIRADIRRVTDGG